MKPKIAVMMAEFVKRGWLVQVAADPPGYGAGSLAVIVARVGSLDLSHPDAHVLVVKPGDDEQLRAALQSLLRSISRSPERL